MWHNPGDPNYLDTEVRAEWWKATGSGERRELVLIARGALGKVQVYRADASILTLTPWEFADGIRRVQEAERRQESVGMTLPGLALKSAERYLERYRERTGTLPSARTWGEALQGKVDRKGRSIEAEFTCGCCGVGHRAALARAEELGERDRSGTLFCDAAGKRCIKTEKKEPLDAPSRRLSLGANSEVSASSSVEFQGFSSAAKQFYKATGKFLHVPAYKGEASEADYLAWKRGAERYFDTYGIIRDPEKVAIGADLLQDEAVVWWNGLWLSGRDAAVRTWEELLDRLRERFLPLEGEMKVVGQWRRLQQLGSVASYADYTYRLKALCELGEVAEFKLAFIGLWHELQAEVRKRSRQTGKKMQGLDELFAIATDAEVGLGLRGGKKAGPKDFASGWPDREDPKKEKGRRLNAVEVQGQGPAESVTTIEGTSRNTASTRGSRRGGSSNRRRGGREDASVTSRESDPWGRMASTARTMPPTGPGATCDICDEAGHGWFSCPKKGSGIGCYRCHSTAHRLLRCPQLQHRREARDPTQHVTLMRARVVAVNNPLPESQLLYYPVKLGKLDTRLLLDSGASVNCVDEALLCKIGGRLDRRLPGVLPYPDERRANVRGTTELWVNIKGHREKVPFWVVRGLGVSALVGRPWLRSWNPDIDWRTGELAFSDGVKWKALKTEGEAQTSMDRSLRKEGV